MLTKPTSPDLTHIPTANFVPFESLFKAGGMEIPLKCRSYDGPTLLPEYSEEKEKETKDTLYSGQKGSITVTFLLCL